ncbi:MerC family mercury resistance protein [Geomonas subterranea]|uniref:MerC family mercury resistance protein n=1 Tax=Geomonas subterranea TaxID=2847989 RepID=UPI001CD5EDCB
MAATLPGIGVALLPKLACPACWPAYAGVLSSLGIGFVNYSPYLLSLTVLFLFLALGSLGFRARRRRGYGPLALGAVAAIIVIAGKFIFSHDGAMYGGVILLMGASLWNSWPRSRKADSSCSCAS